MIVLDTGPLVAALNSKDRHHEACQLVERRQGSAAEASFLRTFGAGLNLVDLTEQDLRRMSTLVAAYASLPLGAVDASVIAIAERLNTPEVATLDRRHFTVVRPQHTHSLLLLPERL